MKIYNINKTIEEVKSEVEMPLEILDPFNAGHIALASEWMRTVESEFVYLYCKDTPYLIEVKNRFHRYYKEEIMDYLYLNAVLVYNGD